jgi:hypothetical protein
MNPVDGSDPTGLSAPGGSICTGSADCNGPGDGPPPGWTSPGGCNGTCTSANDGNPCWGQSCLSGTSGTAGIGDDSPDPQSNSSPAPGTSSASGPRPLPTVSYQPIIYGPASETWFTNWWGTTDADKCSNGNLTDCSTVAVDIFALIANAIGEGPEEDPDGILPPPDDGNAGTSAGCSFTAATQVLLPGGRTAPIASLKPGDKVIATSTKTGKTRPETVVAVEVNHDTDLYDLRVKTSSGVQVIHTTSNHLFWVPYLDKWLPANKLSKGEHLKTATGTARGRRRRHHAEAARRLDVGPDRPRQQRPRLLRDPKRRL